MRLRVIYYVFVTRIYWENLIYDLWFILINVHSCQHQIKHPQCLKLVAWLQDVTIQPQYQYMDISW